MILTLNDALSILEYHGEFSEIARYSFDFQAIFKTIFNQHNNNIQNIVVFISPSHLLSRATWRAGTWQLSWRGKPSHVTGQVCNEYFVEYSMPVYWYCRRFAVQIFWSTIFRLVLSKCCF